MLRLIVKSFSLVGDLFKFQKYYLFKNKATILFSENKQFVGGLTVFFGGSKILSY